MNDEVKAVALVIGMYVAVALIFFAVTVGCAVGLGR